MTSVEVKAERSPVQTALRWALATVALYTALVGVIAVHFDGPEWFLHLGHNNEANLAFARHYFGRDVVVPHRDGHDGRYFWVQARDPFILHPDVDKPLFDPGRATYRFQRVAYPLIAAPWRLLGERALLWGMVATNVVVIGAGAFVATLLALEMGAPARAALGFILSPAVAVAAIGDLSDALAVAALLLTILLLLRGRYGWAMAAGALAVLAKEPMLLGLAGIAVFWKRPTVRRRVLLVAVPLAAAAAWALYVRWRLGWASTRVEEFTAPFKGFVDAWRLSWSPTASWTDAVCALLLIPLAVVIVMRWWRRRSLLLDAAVPFAVLVPFFSMQVLEILLNSVRSIAPAITLLWMDFYVPDSARVSAADTAPPRSH